MEVIEGVEERIKSILTLLLEESEKEFPDDYFMKEIKNEFQKLSAQEQGKIEFFLMRQFFLTSENKYDVALSVFPENDMPESNSGKECEECEECEGFGLIGGCTTCGWSIPDDREVHGKTYVFTGNIDKDDKLTKKIFQEGGWILTDDATDVYGNRLEDMLATWKLKEEKEIE